MVAVDPLVDEEDKVGDEVEDAPLVDLTRPGRGLKSSSVSVYHLSLGLAGRKGGQGRTPHGRRPWPAKSKSTELKLVLLETLGIMVETAWTVVASWPCS